MRIVKSYNKQNGVVYVYEVLGHTYDKEKKFTRSKRRLIGKIDPETGEIVPTRTRNRQEKREKSSVKSDGKVDYQLRYLEVATELQRMQEEFETLKAKHAALQTKYDRLMAGLKELSEQDVRDLKATVENLESVTHQVPVYKLPSKEEPD